ncbi:MAG: tetratricopeptide repeat protein [Acidimicrobiia bacterium]
MRAVPLMCGAALVAYQALAQGERDPDRECLMAQDNRNSSSHGRRSSRSRNGAGSSDKYDSEASREKKPGSGGRSRGGKTTRSSSAAKSGTGSGAKPSKKHYTATTRDVARSQGEQQKKRRRDLQGAAVNLPNWVIEGVERVTPRDRIAATLEALGAASEALADGKYQAAVRHGNRAKALSPQDATIRETIAIAAYRLGDWKTALAELRAYRRIAGETTHLPIEMDVLRAQGRSKDVELAWKELQKRGGHGLVMNEGKIVYASFLLDEGRASEAWKIVDPGRLEQKPNEGHLRLYYVAARTAAALGDKEKARFLSDAIIVEDPSFPGYEELEAEIAAIG